MALNKKFFPKVTSASDTANTFASENFNTVLYTGTGSAQKIGGYINRGATGFAYNKYITFPDMGGFTSNTSDSDGALSIWINFDSIPASSSNYHTIIDKGNPNSTSTYQALELLAFGTSNTNEVEFRFRRGFGGTNYDPSSYTSARATVAVGTWYNLVVSYVASTKTATFYLNSSTAIGSYSLTSALGGRTIDPGFNLGSYVNSSSYSAYAWFGRFDQFRIFNKALSTSEVATLNGETHASTTKSTTDIFSDNSAIALYQFEGNANDTGGGSGKFGSAAIFNGSNSYITIPNIDIFTNTQQVSFSISCWFKTTDTGNGVIATDYPGTNYSFYLSIESGILKSGSYYVNTPQSASGSTTVNDGNWHHVVIINNASDNTQKVYLDGNSTPEISGSLTNGAKSTSTLVIGYFSGLSNYYFDGFIDEFRLYSDVLTTTEIGYIYNNTTASIPTDNLTAYHKFNGDARDEQQLHDGVASNVTYAFNGTPSNITYQEATKFQPDLVWIKQRNDSEAHFLQDSVRGSTETLYSSGNFAEVTEAQGVTSFDSSGFTLGSYGGMNGSGDTYVAWCFNAGSGSSGSNTDGTTTSTVKASQESGFSIVKFPVTNTSINVGHGLSAAPEMIIWKNLDTADNWYVYHKDLTSPNTQWLNLNLSNAVTTNATYNFSAVTSTTFTSHLYAAGGTDNVVSYCFHSVDGYQKIGSYTGNGTSQSIVTGFEVGFVLIKSATSSQNWMIYDSKRSGKNYLIADLTDAEGASGSNLVTFLSNGFSVANSNSENQSGQTFIYLAIAADPDTTTPTVENSFDVVTYSGTNSTQSIDVDFKPDLIWFKNRTGSNSHAIVDSVRGRAKSIYPDDTFAENTSGASNDLVSFDDNGFTVGSVSQSGSTNTSGGSIVAWCWKAGDHDDSLPQINTVGDIESTVSVNDAAGFSIVKYTGNETASQTIGHGLSSSPQIAFIKQLDGGRDWIVPLFTQTSGDYLHLNTDAAEATDTNKWSAVSSTTFTVGADPYTNGTGSPYIAYLWYSVSGHSKISTFAGSNSSQSITELGFAPRWVMIKNMTGVGPWVIHSKPPTTTNPSVNHLRANLSSAQDSGAGEQIDFDSDGFTINYNACGNINCASNTFLYMAFK